MDWLRRGKRGGVMVVLVVLIVALTGCQKVNGGGWMAARLDNGERATFGFTARCVRLPNDPYPFQLYEGQFQYVDTSAGVRLHATLNPFGITDTVTSCAEAAELFNSLLHGDGSTAVFGGDYRPQPSGEAGGFVVQVTDAGQPGLVGDTLCIQLFGGAYDGYENCRALEGGNIQLQ